MEQFDIFWLQNKVHHNFFHHRTVLAYYKLVREFVHPVRMFYHMLSIPSMVRIHRWTLNEEKNVLYFKNNLENLANLW